MVFKNHLHNVFYWPARRNKFWSQTPKELLHDVLWDTPGSEHQHSVAFKLKAQASNYPMHKHVSTELILEILRADRLGYQKEKKQCWHDNKWASFEL